MDPDIESTTAPSVVALGGGHGLAVTLQALRGVTDRITAIVNGTRGITPDTALRLARCFGTSAAFWLEMQTAYDLKTAEREFGEKIAAEVEPA